MQGGVGSSVAAWVEAMTGGFTAGCGMGCVVFFGLGEFFFP